MQLFSNESGTLDEHRIRIRRRRALFSTIGICVLTITAMFLSRMTRAENQRRDSGPAVGQSAPTFNLTDQDGKSVSLSDFSGKLVVLEWVNPTCPFVLRHYKAKTMQTVASDFKDKGVAWISINSTSGTTDASDKQWATSQAVDYPVLNDVKTATGKAYHATNTPEMFILGKDGTILYKGAIDNDPDGDRADGKVNYVRQGLAEILAGKAVSVPETKPYGCHVRYAD